MRPQLDNELSPEAKADFGNALKDVIGNILDRAEQERKASEPYKDLFKASENGLRGILSNASNQIDNIVLTTLTVIQEKFELPRVSDKLFRLIQVLSYASSLCEDNISHKEGFSCCVDKTNHIIYQEILEEIKKIKNE